MFQKPGIALNDLVKNASGVSHCRSMLEETQRLASFYERKFAALRGVEKVNAPPGFRQPTVETS
jgi:hypothetical protein